MFAEYVARLDEERRQRLGGRLARRRLASGTVLFHEGDQAGSAFVVEAGALLIESVTLDGSVVAFGLVGPGEIVGHQGLVGDRPRSATVRAVTGTELIEIDRSTFEHLRGADPAFDRLLVAMLDHRLRATTRFLYEMRGVDARERVRLVLERMRERYGSHVPLSQKVIAALAGTTRQTANEVLRELVDQGVVQLGRGQVVFLDRS